MSLYESVVIARQDISPAQVDTLADDLTKIIEENGGSIAKREHWGLRSLAFRIKKNRKGHYLHMQIDAPAEAVAEMERNMRINEDVMRYLTIKVEALDPEPSSIMQSKGSRDTRGRGEYRSRDGERGGGRPSEQDDKPAPAAADSAAQKPAYASADSVTAAKTETKTETEAEAASE